MLKMVLKSTVIFIFLVIIALFSCKRSSNINKKILQIDISPDISNDNKLQTLIKDLKIVKLQTTDSSLIKYITRLEYINNKFYISTTVNKPIFVFDSIGNFERLIGKNGQGPNEFLQLIDFEVDDKIELYSWPDKTLRFNLDGKLIKTEKAKLPFSKSVKINNNLFALYFGCGTAMANGNTPEDVVFVDSTFNIISKYQNREIFRNKCGISSTIFSKCNNLISYLGEYKDTLFLIKQNIIEPQYLINFGKYQITDEFLKKYQNANPIEYFNRIKGNYASYISFSQNSNYVWIGYYLKMNAFDQHFAIYSKNKAEVLNFSCEKNQPLTRLFSNIISNDKEKFIFYINAGDLISLVNLIKKQLSQNILTRTQYIDSLINLSKQITDTDNPILLILTLNI